MKHFSFKFIFMTALWTLCTSFAAINIYFNPALFKEPLKFNINYPYKPKLSQENNLILITDSMTKVVEIDHTKKEKSLTRELTGGTDKRNSFFNAWDVVMDEQENFYILNVNLNNTGIFIEKEEILKFDKAGKYLSSVYIKDYSDVPEEEKCLIGENTLLSLNYKNGTLYFFEKRADSLVGYQNTRDGVKEFVQIEEPSADELILNVTYSPQNHLILYNDKKSHVVLYDTLEREKKFLSFTNDPGEMKYWIAGTTMDQEGIIYFTDHNNGKIFKYDPNTKEKKLLIDSTTLQAFGYEEELFYFNSIYVNENNKIVCENGNNILIFDDTGKIHDYYHRVAYSSKVVLLKITVGIAALLSLCILFHFCIWIVLRIKHKISAIFYRSMVTIGVVLLCAYLLGSSILTNFTNRYENEVFDALSLLSQIISKGINVELVKRLNEPDDFLNEDYNEIKKEIHGFFNNSADPWNDMYYVSLFKVFDEELFSVFYFTDYEGVYHRSQIPYKNTAYERAYKEKKISKEKFTDAFGNWMYSTAPILDEDGSVVGVIEVGRDLNKFKTESAKLIRLLVRSIGAILIVLILFITELAVLETVNENRKKVLAKQENRIGEQDSLAVRPASFLIELALSIPIALIPIFAQQFCKMENFTPLFGLPESLIIGLPISAEMLFLSLFSVVAGLLIDKYGYKFTVTGGILLLIGGNLLSGFSPNIHIFILARAIAGAGAGCLYYANKYFAVLTSSKQTVNTSLSIMNAGILAGSNFGVTLGSVLTNNFHIRTIFVISSICFLIGFIYIYQVLFSIISNYKDKKDIFTEREKETTNSKGNMLRFFFNPYVWGFFLLFFLPVCATNMFFRYFVPIYAEESGVAISDVSWVFLVYGIIMIYFGPKLSDFFERHFQIKFSLLLSGFIAALGLLVFGLGNAFVIVFIAAIIFAIGDAFGLPVQQNYFMSLKASQKIGGTRSLAAYAALESIGQVTGPLLFGWAMMLGIQRGMVTMGAVMCGLLFIFFFASMGDLKHLKK